MPRLYATATQISLEDMTFRPPNAMQRLLLPALLFLLAGCQYLTPRPVQQPTATPVFEVPFEPAPLLLPEAPADPEPDPAASDSAGVARLMELTRVWHLVRLHHPAVAVRGAPLDSSFIRAVTLVRRASEPAMLELAYTRFLAVLNDPLTRVVQAKGSTENQSTRAAVTGQVTGEVTDEITGEVTVERSADSILVITMPTATRYSERAAVAMREALSDVPNRVILDLRSSGAGADPDSVDAFVARTSLAARLSDITFTASSVRVRRVGGARENQGVWFFDDSWLTSDGLLVPAQAAEPVNVVVLANAQTVMPRAILGLFATGRATLIAENEVRDDALVPSVLVPIGSGLSVRIRTGEVVHVDGTSGVIPDTVITGSGVREGSESTGSSDSGIVNEYSALATAFSILRSGRRVHASRMPVVRAPAQLPGYYDSDPYPYMGSRVLGGARVWSAMRARHSHRDLYDQDIDAAFERAIPRLEAARYAHEYAAVLRSLVSDFDDAQTRLSGASADTVRGIASAPFRVRWVEGRAIISDVVQDNITQALSLVPGLEITAFDGYPMVAWISEHRSDVSAPNEWNRMYQLMQRLPYGPQGNALVRVRDLMGRERELEVPRTEAYIPLLATVERPWQATSRELSAGIAYIDVNRLTEQTAEPELERHRNARAWILDLRGPLADSSRVFNIVLNSVRARPSAVSALELHRYQSEPCLAESLRAAAQQCTDQRELRSRIVTGDTTGHYAGRLVALLDERTSGNMERLAATLEAASDVIFVGSTTAGSPAEAVNVELPGQLSIAGPAAELRRPDGAQWQRIGITPIIDARLTQRAFRSGGDDVVVRAEQWLTEQLDGPARRRR